MKEFFISKTFLISFVIMLILWGIQMDTTATLINFIALICLSILLASIITLILNAIRKTIRHS